MPLVTHVKMKTEIIFLLLLICVNAKIRIIYSDTPLERIGTMLYRKELLTKDYQSPKELAYDLSSRNLYFMYMDDDIQNSGRAYVNILTKRAVKINGIKRNKATAVDPDSGDVYFGSDDGLYKYDAESNKATNIGLYNMNIHKIVVRNNEMYIIDANAHEIFKVLHEVKTAVRIVNVDKVMEFDVDNEKSVHLVNMDGVFCIYKGHEVIKNVDLDVVYHFIVEGNRTYGISDDGSDGPYGIYDIHCNNGTARKVANLDYFPRSFIFGDYGDIFYSINNDIFRLRPVNSFVVYNVHRNRKTISTGELKV